MIAPHIPPLGQCDPQQIEEDGSCQEDKIDRRQGGQADQLPHWGEGKKGKKYGTQQGDQHDRARWPSLQQGDFLCAQKMQDQDLRPHRLQKPSRLKQYNKAGLLSTVGQGSKCAAADRRTQYKKQESKCDDIKNRADWSPKTHETPQCFARPL